MKRLPIAMFLVFVFAAIDGAKGSIQFVSNPNDYFISTEVTNFKITNFENLIDRAVGGTAGLIEVGDTLRGIFNVTNSQNDSSSELRFSDGSFELTGIFEVEVSRVDAANGLFEFVPYAPFATEFSLSAGAMIAAFYDTSPNFSSAGSVAAAELTATNGSLYFSLGANDDWGDVNADGDGYYWASQGSQTPGVASFAASLALLDNNTGIPASNFATLTQLPPAHAGGSFTNEAALGGIGNEFALQGNTVPIAGSPYAVRSQDPLRVQLNAVPEGSAIVTWLILGAVSGGVTLRRRKRAH